MLQKLMTKLSTIIIKMITVFQKDLFYVRVQFFISIGNVERVQEKFSIENFLIVK